jgi:hypothetical protein
LFRRTTRSPLSKVRCPKCRYMCYRVHLKGDGCLVCHDEARCSACGQLIPKTHIEDGKCVMCQIDKLMAESLKDIENWKPVA